MKNRSILSPIIFIAVLTLLFCWVFGVFGSGTADVSYSQIVQLFHDEQVKSFVVKDQKIDLKLHNPYKGDTRLVCALADPESFRQEMAGRKPQPAAGEEKDS